jgi:hypothetical protein
MIPHNVRSLTIVGEVSLYHLRELITYHYWWQHSFAMASSPYACNSGMNTFLLNLVWRLCHQRLVQTRFSSFSKIYNTNLMNAESRKTGGWTLDKVQKQDSSKCTTQSSQPLRIGGLSSAIFHYAWVSATTDDTIARNAIYQWLNKVFVLQSIRCHINGLLSDPSLVGWCHLSCCHLAVAWLHKTIYWILMLPWRREMKVYSVQESELLSTLIYE